MSIDVSALGLYAPPTIQVSQLQLRAVTPGASPRVHVAQLVLVPVPAPPLAQPRVHVASLLLYAVTPGPTPGAGVLHYWDGDTLRPVPHPHVWDGAQLIPT